MTFTACDKVNLSVRGEVKAQLRTNALAVYCRIAHGNRTRKAHTNGLDFTSQPDFGSFVCGGGLSCLFFPCLNRSGWPMDNLDSPGDRPGHTVGPAVLKAVPYHCVLVFKEKWTKIDENRLNYS